MAHNYEITCTSPMAHNYEITCTSPMAHDYELSVSLIESIDQFCRWLFGLLTPYWSEDVVSSNHMTTLEGISIIKQLI